MWGKHYPGCIHEIVLNSTISTHYEVTSVAQLVL